MCFFEGGNFFWSGGSMAVDPTIVALVGTVMGGVGLKVAEHWLGRNKVKVDDASRLRDELRLEITSQKDEIRLLEEAVNKWRDDYYKLYEKHIQLQTELTLALQKIKDEAAAVEQAASQIAKEPPATPQP